MQRIRVNKASDYTTINNTISRDKRVSLKARGLFLTVMSLPDNWDFTVSGIVAIIPDGKTAVYSAIDELIGLGYCERKYTYIGNKRSGVEYTFHEKPINPLNSGFLNLENLNLGNQPQLSKQLIKYPSNINKSADSEEKELFAFYRGVIDQLNSDPAFIKELSKVCASPELIAESIVEEYARIGIYKKYQDIKAHIYRKAKMHVDQVSSFPKLL